MTMLSHGLTELATRGHLTKEAVAWLWMDCLIDSAEKNMLYGLIAQAASKTPRSLTTEECENRVMQTLLCEPSVLRKVAAFLFTDGLEDEDTFELAEAVCVKAFGKRVECACGALVLLGLKCWDCGEELSPHGTSNEHIGTVEKVSAEGETVTARLRYFADEEVAREEAQTPATDAGPKPGPTVKTALETFKGWLKQAGIEHVEERFLASKVTVDKRESTHVVVERGYSHFVSVITFGPNGNLENVEAYE